MSIVLNGLAQALRHHTSNPTRAAKPTPYHIKGGISYVLYPGYIFNPENEAVYYDFLYDKDGNPRPGGQDEIVEVLRGTYRHVGFRLAKEVKDPGRGSTFYYSKRIRPSSAKQGPPHVLGWPNIAPPAKLPTKIKLNIKKRATPDDIEPDWGEGRNVPQRTDAGARGGGTVPAAGQSRAQTRAQGSVQVRTTGTWAEARSNPGLPWRV